MKKLVIVLIVMVALMTGCKRTEQKVEPLGPPAPTIIVENIETEHVIEETLIEETTYWENAKVTTW